MKKVTIVPAFALALIGILFSANTWAAPQTLVCAATYTIENDLTETGTPIEVALREHEARHGDLTENGIGFQVLGVTTGQVELSIRLPRSHPIVFNGSVSTARPLKVTLMPVGITNRQGRAVTILDVVCGVR